MEAGVSSSEALGAFSRTSSTRRKLIFHLQIRFQTTATQIGHEFTSMIPSSSRRSVQKIMEKLSIAGEVVRKFCESNKWSVGIACFFKSPRLTVSSFQRDESYLLR